VSSIPHLRIVVAVSVFVLFGFAFVSAYVLIFSDDEVTKGNIIGTWVNFATLAVGFWVGSSSAGKARPEQPATVQIDQPPDKPVPVEPAS
jgi:hypothetical protein